FCGSWWTHWASRDSKSGCRRVGLKRVPGRARVRGRWHMPGIGANQDAEDPSIRRLSEAEEEVEALDAERRRGALVSLLLSGIAGFTVITATLFFSPEPDGVPETIPPPAQAAAAAPTQA